MDTAEYRALESVVIQSLRLKKNELNSPVPVQSISKSELKQLNALNVADAIRFFSGVQLKDYGGIGGMKTLDVRSMGVNQSSIFYDGLKVSNAQSGQIDLSQFSLSNIEKITLFNSQNNSLMIPAEAYTAGASLYLESVRPHFSDGRQTQIQGDFKSGSFGLVNPSITWQQKITPTFSAVISTELTTAHGEYPFRYKNDYYDTTIIRKNAAINSQRVEGTFFNKFSDDAEWLFKIYDYHSKRGLPGAIVANHFENYQTLRNDQFFVQTSYQKKWKSLNSKINFKYSYDHTRYEDPTFPNQAGKLDNRYHEKALYVSWINEYTIDSKWAVAVSTDYRSTALDANLNQFAYPTRNTWLVALSGKLQTNRLTIQGNLVGTISNEYTKTNASNNFQKISPSISLSWQPLGDQWRIRAFYKNIFRMPTFNDLYYTLLGNASLKPEFVSQYNVGFTYSKLFTSPSVALLSFSVDGYQNFVTDKIIALPNNTLFRWSMLNLGKVNITGVDVASHLDILLGKVNAAFGFNYTYQYAIDADASSYTYQNQIPYTPRHYATAHANFKWQQFNLNYSLIYTGERFNKPMSIPENRVPSWLTHDIGIGKKWAFKNFKLSALIEILNVTNQYYDVVLNYPMPGRNFRISIQFNY